MSLTSSGARTTARTAPPWFAALARRAGPLFQLALVAALGVVLGQQYVTPAPRVIPVLIAIVVAGIAWRLNPVTAVGLLVLAVPYPRGTVFGTTNQALVLILAIIWLVRISTHLSPPPRSTPLDIPAAALLTIYTVSFYNVYPTDMGYAVGDYLTVISAIILYYLIVSTVRSEADLQRLHRFQLASALTIFLLAIFELKYPGKTLFNWIRLDASSYVNAEINLHDTRVGSAFMDFELLSEYCAITLVMVLFLFVRARSNTQRSLLGAFGVLNLFVMFATVTRGAFISFAVGAVYLLWVARRRMRIVPVTIGAAVVAGMFGFMNFFVSTFTRSGDTFARLAGTKVVGWMPDDRAEVWTIAFQRALLHPFIGEGPHYAHVPGFKFWWPHNVYLYYANILGFTGLAIFLWLLAQIWRSTRPQTDTLYDPSYVRAYSLVARVQLIIFMVNEFKIDYLRNPIYQTVVWVMFAAWVAQHQVLREQRLPAGAVFSAGARAPARAS